MREHNPAVLQCLDFIKLFKSIDIDSKATSYDLFEVIGSVRIHYIYGIVTTDLPADVVGASLELYAVDGTLINITDSAVGTDLSNLPAGSVILKDNAAAVALTKLDNTNGFVYDTNSPPYAESLIGQKDGVSSAIRFLKSGAGDSGAITWHIGWSPLSANASVSVI